MTAESRSFSCVTVEMVHVIKDVARTKHGIVFDPGDGTNGIATGRTPIGDCVVHFVHDAVTAVLVLTLVKKPMLLPAALLWAGFEREIECRRRLV